MHDYTFFAGTDMVRESQWANHIKGYVGGYSERTIATEWGGPMTTGSKNGVTYPPMDYNKPATNFFEAYIRGISQQLRDWKMGSFYWPGLRDGDWYSMTTRTGSGALIELTVPNKSGLDRLRYSWADTLVTGVSPKPTTAPLPAFDARSTPGRIDVTITGVLNADATLRLVDLRGRQLRGPTAVLTANGVSRGFLDVAGLPTGAYRLIVELDGQRAEGVTVVLNR